MGFVKVTVMDFLKDLRMVIPKQMVIPMGWQKD